MTDRTIEFAWDSWYLKRIAILHEHLSMRKLCSMWIPRLRTLDQKQERTDDSENYLELFYSNKKDCFMRYVTMDETWINHYIPESNRQSAERSAPCESRPERPKMQMSAGKVLTSVFWSAHMILFLGYLEKGRPINSGYYTALFFAFEGRNCKKNDPEWRRKKCSFTKTMYRVTSRSPQCRNWKCNSCKIEGIALSIVFSSLDMVPSDYYLLENIKQILQGKKFGSNNNWSLFFRPKINRSTKNAPKCKRSIGMTISILKENMLVNKV